VPVVTKSGTISVRLDQVLNLDHVETNMIVNPQTSPPSGFLNTNGMRFQFQLLAPNYCVVHSYVEFDISNTTIAAVQLTPSPFLVDRIRIRNGAGNILQEAMVDQIYQELCFNYSQNQLINLQSLTQVQLLLILMQLLPREPPLHILFLCLVCFWTRLNSLLGHLDWPV